MMLRTETESVGAIHESPAVKITAAETGRFVKRPYIHVSRLRIRRTTIIVSDRIARADDICPYDRTAAPP